MTNDTLFWLAQARSENWSDVQPFGIYILVRFLDILLPGSFLLIVLNIALVVTGLALVLWTSIEKSGRLLLFCLTAVVANPLLFLMFPMAWRDLTGLGLTLLTAGLVFVAVRLEDCLTKSALFFVSAMLAIGGITIRLNHPAGLWPVVGFAIWAVLINRYSHRKSTVIAAGTSLLFLLLSVATYSGISKAVTYESHVEQARINFFLFEMSNIVGINLYPKGYLDDSQ